MRIAKKIFLISISLIALAAIGLYIVFQIRARDSNKELVYATSESVLKISVDDILWDIARNAITNPSYYRGTERSKEKDTLSSPDLYTLLTVPANLYFFTLADNFTNWYVFLKVKDETGLKAYIQDRIDLDSVGILQTADSWNARTADGRLTFVGDAKELLLCVSLNKADSTSQLSNIWSDRNHGMRAVDEMANFEVLKNASDIVWCHVNNKDQVKINFNKDKMICEAELKSYFWQFASAPQARALPSENMLNMFCDADLRPLFDRYGKTVSQQFNISLDSLKQYYGGYVDLQWKKGDLFQQDTIIGYDYDDNFELVEKKEIKKEAVPNLEVHVRMSPHISSYLPQKLFYKFFQNKTHDGLIRFGTADKVEEKLGFRKQDYAFYFAYNRSPNALKYLNWFPDWERILALTIKGKQQNALTSAFYAEMTLDKSEIHVLSQIFRD